MSLHLSQDLAATQQVILRMGTLVGYVVHASLVTLEESVSTVADVANPAVNVDEVNSTAPRCGLPEEREIDRIDVDIEESCLKMLALHQPVAIDLRRIAAILKINTELERIGDLAENIVERASALRSLPVIAIPAKLMVMARDAVSMVDRALIAYTDQRLDLAQQLCLEDERIDQLNREIIAELTETMRTSPTMIEAALHLFSVSRHIERIADHATNIAEDVIYLIEGEIVRHRQLAVVKQPA